MVSDIVFLKMKGPCRILLSSIYYRHYSSRLVSGFKNTKYVFYISFWGFFGHKVKCFYRLLRAQFQKTFKSESIKHLAISEEEQQSFKKIPKNICVLLLLRYLFWNLWVKKKNGVPSPWPCDINFLKRKVSGFWNEFFKTTLSKLDAFDV